MVDSMSRAENEITLSEFLTRRARRASDGRLVFDVAVGVVAACGALLWRPPGWFPLLSAGCCIAAYGAWGMSDRTLGELGEDAHSGTMQRLLRAGRAGAAVVGLLAAGALLLGVLGLALGRWIS